MERTLVLIKPDAVERGLIGEVISAYEKRTLRITDLKMLQPDREIAEKHYEEHKGRPYFETLINYIIEGKIVAMIVEGENAIEMVRKINGDKDPLVSDLASIRGMYSNHKTRNLVHASDSVENAEREIKIWFGN
ncbi:MAG: nucleoside-diphosphate kinase [Clostridiales bacterium]|uniref:nucleoside-diphosphate kinase n=1 Tax=Clostridium sp. N3C TaxID=1776758 RepID=UPI00092E127B|nr:nucleoside-diphosphate kinase [Clostridium sp. N3C]NLZ47449.1 nucleoside-diphosphate kinase [Clostridiales bacterium]SCN21624.1 Nucleoside diphosphate kinase [Clostridium sp. N3C]